MLKIGIITFHRALNYGAVLQAYALHEYLKQCGYEVEIIDYRNFSIECIYHSSKLNLSCLRQNSNNTLKSKIKRLIEIPYLRRLNHQFEHFLDGRITKKTTKKNWNTVISKFDFIITGSDQVLNKILTNADMKYYLSGVPRQKRVSFAASFGAFDIEKDCEGIQELDKFQGLSLREQVSADKMKKLVNKDCYCHMDPIFLLSKERWEKQQKSPKIRQRYVLIFSMNKALGLVKKAYQYAKERKLCTIFLSPSIGRTLKYGIKQIWCASPEEFLGWISYAEYIFTDSFHGCAFSILYEKKFFVEIDRNRASSNRMINILEYFECEENAQSDKIGEVKSNKITTQLKKNRENVNHYFNLLKEEM